MTDKGQPVGICDYCLGPIPPGEWYTRRGPRLYCSIDCRNTANARAGAAIISRKNKERIAAGTWRNPAELRPPTPEEQAHRARLGRLREVAAGRWRNPALDPAARAKLSRPRKHTGELASAIDKLNRGTMADLTEGERAAYHNYRKRQRATLAARMTPAQRDHRRAQWRTHYHRQRGRKRAPDRQV